MQRNLYDYLAKLDTFGELAIPLEVRIECREMTLEDLIHLDVGSLIPLDKPAGETLDVFVGNLLLASAEVVVVDDRLGVRLTDIYAADNSDSAPAHKAAA